MPRYRLTCKIKLAAMAHKYYNGAKWEPKPGDFYSTSRNDLELYVVVNVDDHSVYTKYYNPSFSDTVSQWPKDEFLAGHTFGTHRVHVPEWAFGLEESIDDNA